MQIIIINIYTKDTFKIKNKKKEREKEREKYKQIDKNRHLSNIKWNK